MDSHTLKFKIIPLHILITCLCVSPTLCKSLVTRHFKCDDVIRICGGVIFDSYMGLPHVASPTVFARFGTLHNVTSFPLLSGVQGLFRNFGATFVPLLKPHLEKLAVDSQVLMFACMELV